MSTPSSNTASRLTPRPGITPAASSPPRSVPSPYLQPKAGKSPHKHPSPHGATPLHPGSSPAATRNGRNLTSEALTPNLSGLGLDLNASNLNATILDSFIAGNNEEERNLRIATIVKSLARWGLVSQEGVERCAQRLGLECLWDDAGGERILSIAGTGLLVDIKWQGEVVKGVVLTFDGAGEWAQRSSGAGAAILKRNLVGDGFGYVSLDRFAENLAMLARTDQLGKKDLNCFEAVEGVHGCFKKIWEWQVAQAKETGADETEVLCHQGGRPRIHCQGRIGLKLQYWMDRRLVPRRTQAANQVELDDQDDEDANLWSLLIECEAFSAELYPSIRISDAWMSQPTKSAIVLEGVNSSSLIEWLEPGPTLVTTEIQPGTMDVDTGLINQPQFPYIRFVARLDPPVTLPLDIAIEIFNLVGNPIVQESVQSTTYTFLVLPQPTEASNKMPNLTQEQTLGFSRVLRSWENDECAMFNYKFKLSMQNHSWARTVHEIPFSHPRQLIAILPVLRQWAFLERLLQRTFGIYDEISAKQMPLKRESVLNSPSSKVAKAAGTAYHHPSSIPSDTDSDSEDETPLVKKRGVRGTLIPPVAIFLCFDNQPYITITLFPGNGVPSVKFQIGPNADIVLVDTEEDEAMHAEREKLARALRVSEDLGVVVEWLRERKAGKSGGEADGNESSGRTGKTE